MKFWQFVFTVALVLFGAGLVIHHLGDTSPNKGDAPIVEAAVDALRKSGRSAFLQGGGLNISEDKPFVSSQGVSQAVVTIPYRVSAGPALDPKVTLTLNPKTGQWTAVAYTDGGGVRHLMD